MREMGKYRGRRKDNGEWVKGYYIKDGKCHYIYPRIRKCSFLGNFIAVIPETVGQSTGLKDKNGVDLDWWEGDTLKSPDGERAIIVYNTLGAGFYAKRPQDNYFWLPIYKVWKQGWSRIGNIHEEKL